MDFKNNKIQQDLTNSGQLVANALSKSVEARIIEELLKICSGGL
jgi:hypothetical protein